MQKYCHPLLEMKILENQNILTFHGDKWTKRLCMTFTCKFSGFCRKTARKIIFLARLRKVLTNSYLNDFKIRKSRNLTIFRDLTERHTIHKLSKLHVARYNGNIIPMYSIIARIMKSMNFYIKSHKEQAQYKANKHKVAVYKRKIYIAKKLSVIFIYLYQTI